MPALKKRALQAKQQSASGGLTFDSGLADSLSDLILDPSYVPEEGSGEEDFDFDEFPCVFSLIEEDVTEVDIVEGDCCVIDANIGEKRSFRALQDGTRHVLEGDLETDRAISSAQTTCKFWNEQFSNVK